MFMGATIPERRTRPRRSGSGQHPADPLDVGRRQGRSDAARSAPSAQTWVTGSAGSGTTRAHPGRRRTLMPSTRTSSAPSSVSCSMRVRMTRPFCSMRVATSSCRIGMGGVASTISAREVGLSSRSDTSRARAAAASKAGRKAGKTYPPRWSDAKDTPPDAAASSSPDGDSGVKTTSTTAFAAAAYGAIARRHRERDPTGLPGLRRQLDEGHDRLVVGQHVARPVDQGEALAAGVDDRAQVGARPAHRVGHPRLAHGAIDRDHARRLRVRVDAEHVCPHLGEQDWA